MHGRKVMEKICQPTHWWCVYCLEQRSVCLSGWEWPKVSRFLWQTVSLLWHMNYPLGYGCITHKSILLQCFYKILLKLTLANLLDKSMFFFISSQKNNFHSCDSEIIVSQRDLRASASASLLRILDRLTAVSLYVATICYIKDDLLLGVNSLTSKREKNTLQHVKTQQMQRCGESRIVGQHVCTGEPGVQTD